MSGSSRFETALTFEARSFGVPQDDNRDSCAGDGDRDGVGCGGGGDGAIERRSRLIRNPPHIHYYRT